MPPVARCSVAGALVAAASLALAASAAATFPAPDGALIAFDSYGNGTSSVFLVRRDGTHERRVGPPGEFAQQPAFSPNGRRIAFDGEPPGKGDQVEVMRLDGSHVRDLAPTDAPTWSPNGRRIAFRHGDNLATMRADGSHLRTITHGKLDLGPTWAPNGRRIAFQSFGASGPSQIAVVNVRGAHRHTITSEGGYGPDFAPNGRRIAYTNNPPGAPPARIVTIRPDGTHRRVLIVNARDAAFSPNGKLIVFDRYDGQHDQLWIAHADGTHQRQITHDAIDHDDPSWQPRPSGR
jgi:Tol biopolymer transport system component